jgi:ATP/ADP translocase
LASHLPGSFSAPLAIIRNWSFAVFYVMAEMWGSVVASLLFWGVANEVTTVEEAKKYCTCKSKESVETPSGLTAHKISHFFFFRI